MALSSSQKLDQRLYYYQSKVTLAVNTEYTEYAGLRLLSASTGTAGVFQHACAACAGHFRFRAAQRRAESPFLPQLVSLTASCVQVVHANILGVLVLHDSVHWYSFAGAGSIIAGVLLTQQGRRAVEKAEQQQRDDADLLEALDDGPAPPSVAQNAYMAAGDAGKHEYHARSSISGW